MPRRALLIPLAFTGLSACAWGYDGHGEGGYARSGPAYRGREWVEPRRPFEGALTGPGVAILDDWLKETAEGRAVVTLGFRDAARGVVSEDIAHRANIWFRLYADQNRDMILTDPEIRTALVAAAGRYVRRRPHG